jgi:uncharacterized protein with HEPN domain
VSLSPLEYIRHIPDEIDYILAQVPNTDFASFQKDATLKRAFVRSIEIIGEAAKKLSEDVKARQSDIEWRKISGMRDRLIHDYFGVDYTIVWDVATTKLPELRVKFQALFEIIEKHQQAGELLT